MTVTAIDTARPVGRAFGRRCVVTIEPRKELTKTSATTGLQPVLVLNTDTDGLRVRFKFVKPAIWTPNTATVEIFNLAPDTRARLQDKNVRVTVLAGYGSNLKLAGIFNAQQVNHKHEGPDWISKFEGGDGGQPFWHSRISKTFSGGTPKFDVAKQMLQSQGKLSPGAESILRQHSAGQSLKHSRTFAARNASEVRYILAELGLEHTVQDEEVIVYPKNGTTRDVYVITPESGLVGSPEYAAPPHPGKPKLLKIRTLMIPELRQRSLIQLQSAAHSGSFVLREVTHTGDTHSNDWFSDMEMGALKGAR
jgi:hypothetical protein